MLRTLRTLVPTRSPHLTSILRPSEYNTMRNRVQRIWLCFRKWRIQTLWWVQNWNLRHIYWIRFFDFLSRFLRVWLQSLKKVLIWPTNFFLFQKRCQKTQNFTLITNPLKMLFKNAPKKVISKTSLTNMSKSEKSAYFCHVFANNFFLVRFFKPFQWIRNQHEILRFHISTFFKLWLQMRRKRLKKKENICLWMCLKI